MAEYFVTQNGIGDGSTIDEPDSIADFKAGVFGEIDGDTIWIMDTIDDQINIPDGGTLGNVVNIRGDYVGRECTIDTTGNYGILINNINYVTIRGFTITGAVISGVSYYCTQDSTDVSIINCSIDGNARTEMTTGGIQSLVVGPYTITNLTLTNCSSSNCDGFGIKVHAQNGGDYVSWEVHDNYTSGNGQHGHAFTDVGTNIQEVYNLVSNGDGDDPGGSGWMGVAFTAINVNKVSFTNYAGNIYYVTGGIGTDTAYYLLNNSDTEYLIRNAGNWDSLGVNEWDQNGADLYFNIGGDPTGKVIRYARGRCENIEIHDIFVSNTIDANNEGDGFTFDGFASNNTLYRLFSQDNEGSGFISNMGSGNVVYSSICTGNADFGFAFLKQHDTTNQRLINCTAYNNGNSGIRTSSDMVVLDVYNCISSDNSGYGGSGANNSTVNADYNILYNNTLGETQNAWTQGANSLNVNPRFISTAYKNFTLQSDSPAINAGTNPWSDGDGDIYSYNNVLLFYDGSDSAVAPGGTIDIGAYEYDGGLMSINCEVIGRIPQPLSSSDEVQPTFDISTWLSSDQILSVAYSAFDERGTDSTAAVLTLAKHANTTTLIKPWIKGGGTSKKRYTVEMLATTINGEKKAFYIKYAVRDIGQ